MSDFNRFGARRGLIEDYLMDEADPRSRETAEVARAGEITGVSLPETGPIQLGAILSPSYARRLGAQLIRAADLHDAIYECGVEVGTRSANQPRPLDDPRGEADR